jgi:hypothetical protein
LRQFSLTPALSWRERESFETAISVFRHGGNFFP